MHTVDTGVWFICSQQWIEVKTPSSSQTVGCVLFKSSEEENAAQEEATSVITEAQKPTTAPTNPPQTLCPPALDFPSGPDSESCLETHNHQIPKSNDQPNTARIAKFTFEDLSGVPAPDSTSEEETIVETDEAGKATDPMAMAIEKELEEQLARSMAGLHKQTLITGAIVQKQNDELEALSQRWSEDKDILIPMSGEPEKAAREEVGKKAWGKLRTLVVSSSKHRNARSECSLGERLRRTGKHALAPISRWKLRQEEGWTRLSG